MDKEAGRGKLRYIDFLSMGLLGIVCFCYALFNSDFAESHIKLPFLDFPIFIGEIFLGVAMILAIIKIRSVPFRLKKWHYLLFVYIGFIIIKAFYGYYKWGSLAYRNSALLYYPLFAVIAYYIFDKRFFKNKLIIYLLPALLLGGLVFRLVSVYYYFSLFIFLIIFAFLINKRTIKYIFVLLLIALFIHLLSFIQIRGILLGTFFSGLFIFFIHGFYLLRTKLRYRIIYFFTTILLLAVGFWIFADKSDILAIFPNSQDIEFYKNTYNESKDYTVSDVEPAQIKVYEANSQYLEKWEFLKENKIKSADAGFTPIEIDSNNMLWRLFVWSDMLEELVGSKNIFGLDFGKPFRSKTIEFLGWQDSKWVGWIEPHNSYVHILYRAGIVGLLLIFVILFLFIKMVKDFIKQRSVIGVLLSSILLYWIVVAGFEVALELPYFAIPFWSLFGIAKAYQMSKISDVSNLKDEGLGE